METINIILKVLTIIGSLGMFLFGMKFMSEALQKVAGEKMRNILAAITANRFRGLLTGLVVTAAIQSSSATTVMLVSFVNAGLMSLVESISIIMGANIGTTITPWLISLLGFGKTFHISMALLPLIAISMPMMFSRKSKRRSFAEFIFGFAILFIGLNFLKENVPAVDQSTYFFEHFSSYSQTTFIDILLFVGIGLLLTIIFQSSSATIALTFVIATQGWISFPLAAAMVLGENIGTTSTALFASIVGNISSKRTAFSHLLFNLFGVIWALILLRFLLLGSNYLTFQFIGISSYNNPLAIPVALSIFHTGFNVLNSLILIYLIPYIVLLSRYIIPRKDSETDDAFKLQYIDSTVFSTSELSLIQAKKEVAMLGTRVSEMFEAIPELLMEKRPKKYKKTYNRIKNTEEAINSLEIIIANYLTKLSDGHLSNQSTKQVRAMLKIIDEIESIGDICASMANIIDHKNNQNAYFTQDTRNNLFIIFDDVRAALEVMINNLNNEYRLVAIDKAKELEDKINQTRNKIREQHIIDIDKGAYAYQTGVFYSEIFTLSEKIGDFIINVTEAIVDSK